MRVPVIAVLPAQKPLRDSALAAVQGRSPAVVSAATAPKQLAIDAGFAAVPLGAGRVEERVSLEALAPDASEKFAVRGFVDAATVGEIPHAVDGHPIFADPHIAPLVTCGGTGPVGSNANVATKLNVAALAAKNLNGAGVAIAIMDTGINLQHLTNKLGFSPGLNVGNSWTPPGTSIAPGQHPVNHGTMCAFDVLIAAPKATLLDFPILASTAPRRPSAKLRRSCTYRFRTSTRHMASCPSAKISTPCKSIPSTSRPSAKAPSHIAGRFPTPGSNRSARCKPHLKLISRNASLHATASRIVDDAAEGWAGRAPSR